MRLPAAALVAHDHPLVDRINGAGVLGGPRDRAGTAAEDDLRGRARGWCWRRTRQGVSAVPNLFLFLAHSTHSSGAIAARQRGEGDAVAEAVEVHVRDVVPVKVHLADAQVAVGLGGSDPFGCHDQVLVHPVEGEALLDPRTVRPRGPEQVVRRLREIEPLGGATAEAVCAPTPSPSAASEAPAPARMRVRRERRKPGAWFMRTPRV